MGWAENRIERHHRGGAANWLERRMLEHANPVHFPMALAVSGHVHCWTREDEQIRRRLVTPGRDGSVGRASCIVSIGPEEEPYTERADVPRG